MTEFKGTEALVLAGLAIGLLFFCSVLYAIPVWILWNWLAPAVFGLSKITLFQAWGLSFLSSLLLKSTNTATVSK